METYGRRSASQAKIGGTPQWTKSGGWVNLRQRQDDLYNSGMPGENPFQSMYQATISAQGAQRAQTAIGGRNKTPASKRTKTQMLERTGTVYNKTAKSAQKMETAIAREQIRKFGEYEEGVQPVTQSIWNATACK